jgi:hypothetical protein
MRHALPGMFLLLTAPISMACPTSSRDQITWVSPQGVDTQLCTAKLAGSSGTEISVFYSNYPPFFDGSTKHREPGIAGGHTVEWYITTTKEGKFRRDAIITSGSSDKPDGYIHVWLTADRSADLEAAKKLVQFLQF